MNDEWRTPPDLFAKIQAEFSLDWDAACTSHNCITMNGCFEHGDNSLALDWSKYSKNIWLNPPYSRGNIEPFMEKAWKESKNCEYVVCLVRFDPSTKWFQQYVHNKADEVLMLKRRVKFIGAPAAYNFPTCIVVYHLNVIEDTETTLYSLWDWK